MPIRPEHRFFFPIDRPQLSAVIRLRRPGGCCEGCGRPHGQRVYCHSDGRRWDRELGTWRDDMGKAVRSPPSVDDLIAGIRVTKAVLAAAHRDHDTSNNADGNLAAFCQRCHMIHDRPKYQRRRWRTLVRRKTLGDLFGGPYV
jgi:hypothetical protein